MQHLVQQGAVISDEVAAASWQVEGDGSPIARSRTESVTKVFSRAAQLRPLTRAIFVGNFAWCPCLNSKMATFTPVEMLATLATFEKSQ